MQKEKNTGLYFVFIEREIFLSNLITSHERFYWGTKSEKLNQVNRNTGEKLDNAGEMKNTTISPLRRKKELTELN